MLICGKDDRTCRALSQESGSLYCGNAVRTGHHQDGWPLIAARARLGITQPGSGRIAKVLITWGLSLHTKYITTIITQEKIWLCLPVLVWGSERAGWCCFVVILDENNVGPPAIHAGRALDILCWMMALPNEACGHYIMTSHCIIYLTDIPGLNTASRMLRFKA